MSTLYAVSPLGLLARWSIRSQEQARRNAMTACTILTARRVERSEVEAFVADYLSRQIRACEPTPVVQVGHVG